MNETLESKLVRLHKLLPALNEIQSLSQELSVGLIEESFSEAPNAKLALQVKALLFSQLTNQTAGASVAFARVLVEFGVPLSSLSLKSSLAK